MKKEKRHKDFIPSPEYPGGSKAMAIFISQNLKYPKTAFDTKIEGTVVIKGEINFEGKIIQTKVISSLHPDCDAEAQRVVSLLKFNIDKIRNVKVSYFKTFHIHFKLPTPPSVQMNINYTVTQNPDVKISQTPSEPTYHYTVVIPKKS
ncbi:MAG: TonB family protein [Saprospiraceae bacterium]|nr:TonB family protein [Saprospiraceae bacterium]